MHKNNVTSDAYKKLTKYSSAGRLFKAVGDELTKNKMRVIRIQTTALITSEIRNFG